jgi:regulator of protease activity HflC (stomatin/prohibitin superfamily)
MNTETITEERPASASSGMAMLILLIVGITVGTGGFIWGTILASTQGATVFNISLIVVTGLVAFIIFPIMFAGLKILKPNEALVLTLFGRYVGTLKGPGYFFVNPFVTAVAPSHTGLTSGSVPGEKSQAVNIGNVSIPVSGANAAGANKRISLKAMTLCNDKQKINDALGNPVIIGIVVVWKVVNTAKAVFSVDNYTEFLSIQCDSALRNIVRMYPYDTPDEEGEKSLRGSSQEIAESLKAEIQKKVEIAGLEIVEARITHLSYAPEIAAAMLQKQQASAIVAARQLIVEGAVGMVEMALAKLNDNHIVDLDEERKAAMVSNLLVVLCGNKEAQPIVNSGTIY